MSLLPTQLEEWKRTSPGFINLVQQSAVAVNNIQAPNLLEFVIQVIKCFSPVNLSHPRIIANRGPYYFQKTLLETRYQNEFYRCCYDLTPGSTTSLTEFCGTTCSSSTAAADGVAVQPHHSERSTNVLRYTSLVTLPNHPFGFLSILSEHRQQQQQQLQHLF